MGAAIPATHERRSDPPRGLGSDIPENEMPERPTPRPSAAPRSASEFASISGPHMDRPHGPVDLSLSTDLRIFERRESKGSLSIPLSVRPPIDPPRDISVIEQG